MKQSKANWSTPKEGFWDIFFQYQERFENEFIKHFKITPELP